MEKNEYDKNWEKRIRFVTRHYKEKGLDTERAWKTFAREQGIKTIIPFRRYLYSAASVLLILITIGSLYVWNQGRPQWVTITSGAGEVKQVILSDQTSLTLAGGSRITYDARRFPAKGRDIELAGKAWFDIQRDEEHPFTVITALSKVVVLGTNFELADSGEEVSLYVYTGTVSFSPDKGEEVILTAGMSVHYSPEQESVEVSEEINPNRLSWKTNELNFNNTPLAQVIRDLEDHYHIRIRNIPSQSELSLTASFSRMPPEEVLLIINQTLDIGLQAIPLTD